MKILNHCPDIDKETLQQFEDCAKQKFVTQAALMPDAHKGYVAPIGAVLVTKDFIVPSWVGFDIGCGMIAIQLKSKDILKKVQANKEKIYSQILKKIPMGLGEKNKLEKVSEKTKKHFKEILNNLEKKEHDKKIFNYLKSSSPYYLGTLGAGNHFIEISQSKKQVWLVIHSGSRKIGHEIAKQYMMKASNSNKNYEQTFPLKANSNLGKEYLNALDFCLEFALLNRMEMSYQIINILEQILKTKIKTNFWANKNHNHAVFEKGFYIHRKGATPSKKGEKGIIPGNMRDGTYLVKGKGNKEFLNSSSHGAGRLMSRSQARQKISIKDFQDSMKGIKSNLSSKIIDEAPMAYKNIDKVMQAQKKSVKIIKHLKPILNFKG
ncbi:MAG: RtcB family protein [Nanoarchaeota archaeon]|nr:RtcB family protein [Nanoarchaeota archaeon]